MSTVEKLTQITVDSKSEFIKTKLQAYMGERPIWPVVVECEVMDNYIFYIGWAVAQDKNVFSHAYKMLVTSIYGEVLYEDTNIICSKAYDLNTVKEKCKGYFNYHAAIFNNLIP